MDFYPELLEIEKQLTAKDFIVHIPASAQIMKQSGNFSPANFRGEYSAEERRNLIKQNFKHIAEADNLLVINHAKKGIEGYIGTSVLMEIGIAFNAGTKIYLLNPVAKDAPYAEEMTTLGCIVINGDLSKIE